jgi:hypothetical protein
VAARLHAELDGQFDGCVDRVSHGTLHASGDLHDRVLAQCGTTVMTERPDAGEGFSVLDGLASVMGAAVASVHMRGLIRDGLSAFGWVLVWWTFTWVAITATGPFLFVVRRFARRLADYPKVGDKLWAILGLPWISTAFLRSAAHGRGPQHDELFAMSLSLGLAFVSLIAMIVVWRTWVMVPPDRAARTAATPWTNRVGLVLSVAWPVQCGMGLVVAG